MASYDQRQHYIISLKCLLGTNSLYINSASGVETVLVREREEIGVIYTDARLQTLDLSRIVQILGTGCSVSKT